VALTEEESGVLSQLDGDALVAFARAYLRRGIPDPQPSPDALAEEIRGAFALADSRDGASVAVRAATSPHGGSLLETNTPDLPFLVDSVHGELHARGLEIVRDTHPIVGVKRDAAGHIARIGDPRELPSESVMHFELDRRLDAAELADLEDAVRYVLGKVQSVVGDFRAMTERVEAFAEQATDEDEAAFLRWLLDGHFVLLGVVGGGRNLGLARGGVPDGKGLHIGKTAEIATVHRRARMDSMILGGRGRIIGLFTSRAYAEPASSTPLLNKKLERILSSLDLIEGSHDYKAAVALYESFPKDELFAATAEELQGAVSALIGLRADESKLLTRRSTDGRSVSIIAAVPRDRLSADVRERVRELIAERYGADHVDVHEVLGEDNRMQVHLIAYSSATLNDVPTSELQAAVRDLARTWADRVREQLVARHGDERGRMLAARWAKRVPEQYKASVTPATGAEDIGCLERLATGGTDLVVGLVDDDSRPDERRTRVSLYKRGPKVELGRATPLLEHLGLRAIEEFPTRLEGEQELWVQSFTVLGPGDAPLDLDAVGGRVAETLSAVWHGESESDSLNRLVVSTDLGWEQIEILRAYRRYRQRIGSRYTESFQNDVIAANPRLTEKLMRLFELRFDPENRGSVDACTALREEILKDLDAVELLDHDRILRNQLGLIEATVRTNVYARGHDAMAFKLRSGEVPAIPQPAPMFEIYVYAPDMEGIHLRGGRIARGGIRWSDRMDYRTEVFGLMRAQMTKNAIIVPAGAKGGFFLKERPSDPVQLKREVERQYVRYIEALLDVTDNLVDGGVSHPEGVIVHDEDDTYLVVAADKGTATFSDTANEIAVRRKFWLGDAFASGGSAGYDHKALGITAKGAWESVKRHFRELGIDPEADVITAVGIGDMSGDVFGNGMLLSKTLKLVAAYDHRHVFIDPDSEPARSWEERKRLFELAGSSWDDYDKELLSEGGGVYPRAAKRIELSEQARSVLGIEHDDVLSPAEVIQAILRAPVDLLWNGGIGTVVKASTESDADALDRSSDSIRVDADQLRCRVIGEGGNLGLTQRARIEFAQRGGHVNADFIDNSAGVDCSDHEVNLKILLDVAVRAGDLTHEERDGLLRDVTDDVVRHVLEDSYLQAQIIGQEVQESAARVYAYEDLMAQLEEEGLLSRAVEKLPPSDVMAERRRSGDGLVRPELAVLLSDAKRSLTDALLEGTLVDEAFFESDLRAYFPPAVVERFGHLLLEHPLRRELVATIVSNDALNSMGSTFASQLQNELGAPPEEIVRAYRMACEVTGARKRWERIDELGTQVDPEVGWELVRGVDTLVSDVARWFLTLAQGADIRETIDLHRAGFEKLEHAMHQMRDEDWRNEHDAYAAELEGRGVPRELAQTHAFQRAMIHAPDAVAVARETGRDVLEAARALFEIGEGLRLEWLEGEIERLPSATRLQRWAEQAVLDDVLEARRVLALKALQEHPDASAEDAVAAFLESRAGPRRRLASFTRALALEGSTDLAGLSLAVRHLRELAR
jgi:glutamate dehydrogenase